MIPVCLGHATKLCDMLTEKDKTYETVMLLGRVTDTQDVSGKILKENDAWVIRKDGGLTDRDIETAIMEFVGDYNQIPPMYSALKVNGKKLYELARAGIEIERSPRPVKIMSIEDIRIDFPRVFMRVTCSKGTYIRTLCHDIGQKLNCGACMETLRRTRVSSFDISQSLTLDRISKIMDNGEDIEKYIISVEEVFEDYPRISTMDKFDRLLYNGNCVEKSMLNNPECEFLDGMKFRMYDSKGKFIGIFYYSGKDELIKCDKMFFAAQ